MTDTTPRTGAPLLAASQAQKHVTLNEALYQFDAFLCACFISRTLATPPSSPNDGDTYLVATGGAGTWLGQDGNIAYSADGAWRFYPPFAGLSAYVGAESKLIVYNGSAWCDFASMIAMQNLPMIGVNTTADSTNKLSVQSNAVLFSDVATGSGGTGDIRATLSKQASSNTASFLFQDNFSGRAEIGLTGDDNFHFKVSPDGTAWTDAMDIAASTGVVTLASSVLTTADINGGTVDGAIIGGTTPAAATVSKLQVNGTASAQAYIVGSGSYTYDLNIITSTSVTPALLVPDATISANGNATSNACLWVRQSSGNSRSINAAGTINASGADYAEYETKAAGCGAIAKGQIVGFDANGLVTDLWANALSFGIKSTSPSYVGGDIWGTDATLGEPPQMPEPVTRGRDQTDDEWAADQAAFATAMTSYTAAATAYAAAIEAARANVDRIAYSGKVPCNAAGANVGDYIVAVQSGDAIAGQAVATASIIFAQYQTAVGRVRRIIDAGHCEVAVIVH